jgi:hypothetical protein
MRHHHIVDFALLLFGSLGDSAAAQEGRLSDAAAQPAAGINFAILCVATGKRA